MKIPAVLLIFLASSVAAFGQRSCSMPAMRTYAVEPSATIVTTTTILDDVTKYYVHFKNITGSDLHLGWKKLSMVMPDGWDYSLCDLGTCYAGIPDGDHEMFTVAKDSSGFLAPNLYPNDIQGSFTLTMLVWDFDDPTIFDTITWHVTATASSSVKSTSKKSVLTVSPNPTTEKVTLTFSTPLSGSVSVVSPSGATIYSTSILNNSGVTIDVHSFSSGEYQVIATTSNGRILQGKFIKQ